MRLGPEAMEALKNEVGSLILPGDELVVAGGTALSGASSIAQYKKEELEKRFSVNFVYEMMHLRDTFGVEPSALDELQKMGIHLCFPMGEGGFLAALWKAAEASDVSLSIDLRKVPIRQEIIEECEFFDLNPYQLEAVGGWIISAPSGQRLVDTLTRKGIMAAVIGTAGKGRERVLYSGEQKRYLDRPAPDELGKIMEQ